MIIITIIIIIMMIIITTYIIIILSRCTLFSVSVNSFNSIYRSFSI